MAPTRLTAAALDARGGGGSRPPSRTPRNRPRSAADPAPGVGCAPFLRSSGSGGGGGATEMRRAPSDPLTPGSSPGLDPGSGYGLPPRLSAFPNSSRPASKHRGSSPGLRFCPVLEEFGKRWWRGSGRDVPHAIRCAHPRFESGPGSRIRLWCASPPSRTPQDRPRSAADPAPGVGSAPFLRSSGSGGGGGAAEMCRTPSDALTPGSSPGLDPGSGYGVPLRLPELLKTGPEAPRIQPRASVLPRS